MSDDVAIVAVIGDVISQEKLNEITLAMHKSLRRSRAEGLREAARMADEKAEKKSAWDDYAEKEIAELEFFAIDCRARADAIERGEE